jgi:hypothetical protein
MLCRALEFGGGGDGKVGKVLESSRGRFPEEAILKERDKNHTVWLANTTLYSFFASGIAS